MIKKAYSYADILHAGTFRQSGEPYIIHPLNVAYILAELGADCDTICAALLHDIGNPPFGHFGEDAIKSFCAIHNIDESSNIGDITKVKGKELPYCDLYIGVFPCQDIS